MSINITLIGQAITFLIFVWFTMKFVWPLIIKAMEDRAQTIADGLAAAERGHYELEKAHSQAEKELRDAKVESMSIIEKANQRADLIIAEAETKAKEKHAQILQQAQEELVNIQAKLREELRKQVIDIAVLGAEKIIKTKIDSKAQNDLLADIVKQL